MIINRLHSALRITNNQLGITALIFLIIPVFAKAQISVSTLIDNFNASGGVKVAPNGDIYVADFGESLDNGQGTLVWKVSPDGTYSVFATGLLGASGNAFDSKGNLFQSNIALGKVSKITPDGNVSDFTSEGISCNVGIATNDNDDLFVCNCCGANGNTIRKITSAGVSSQFASGFLFRCPNGITRDDNGNFYVSNFGNGDIIKITPDGQASRLATTPRSPELAASNGHIAYSPNEDILYVASHAANIIYRLTPDGQLTPFAGSGQRGNTDGSAFEASFSRPNGIGVSHTGDTLYINSSIPTTNTNGRPLNPSKLRMITNVRGLSSSENIGSNFKKIEISPNPVSEVLKLKFVLKEAGNMTINLVDKTGTILKTTVDNDFFPSGKSVLEISTTEFSKGIYFLQIIDNQKITTRKFSKI